jgi:hypothetical protein
MPSSPEGNTVTTGINAPVASPLTKIYNPAAVGTPHVVIFNNGMSGAYIGGSAVSSTSGLLFPPGAQLTLPYANYSIWGIDGGVTTGAPATSLQTAAATGGTTLTLASSGTVFATAQTIAVGAGTGIEFVTLATIAGTVLTTTTGLLYDHNASATVTTITGQPGVTSLSVNPGTT